MPLIVNRADWQRWLEPTLDNRPPIDLLRPFDSELMNAWRSDAAINNVRNTGPELGMRSSGDGENQRLFD
jgi:putative SOS response-associated peptidase YedK